MSEKDLTFETKRYGEFQVWDKDGNRIPAEEYTELEEEMTASLAAVRMKPSTSLSVAAAFGLPMTEKHKEALRKAFLLDHHDLISPWMYTDAQLRALTQMRLWKATVHGPVT